MGEIKSGGSPKSVGNPVSPGTKPPPSKVEERLDGSKQLIPSRGDSRNFLANYVRVSMLQGCVRDFWTFLPVKRRLS